MKFVTIFTVHAIKPTNLLMLKLYYIFYTQFVITQTCFDLSWSWGSYWTSI